MTNILRKNNKTYNDYEQVEPMMTYFFRYSGSSSYRKNADLKISQIYVTNTKSKHIKSGTGLTE